MTESNHIYKGVKPVQRNFDFSASFNAYYLADSNNLLTHTHTHTHTQLAHLAFKRLRVRAREERATSINKGLRRVPFVRFFMSFREQKMNEITSQNVGTNGSCVHSIRLTSKQVDELMSRQLTGHWSGRTSRASLHAPCTQRNKESKTKEYLIL